MDELLQDFLTETLENLGTLDVELVKFEQDPTEAETLMNIFRLVHTIKGTSGFLGLTRLEKVAHHGEDVLGKFRDGELQVTPEAVTLVLKCIDTIREIIDGLEAAGEEPSGDDTALIAALSAMAEGKSPSAAEVEAAAPAGADTDTDADNASVNEFGAPVAAELLAEVEAAGGDVESDADPESGEVATNDFGAPVAAELLAEVEGALSVGKRAATDDEIQQEIAAAEKEDDADEPPAAAVAPAPAPTAQEAEKKDAEKKGDSVAASSIRVHVDVLEDLMTLVSELVLTRNQLLQMVRGQDESEFAVPLQRLSHITTDIQEGVMKTRMQPIGNAWAKLPRIIRDLAIESGKKIDLRMHGEDTELDRQILDLIKDPLTHMIRNSADHGIEMPADREAVGKPATGTINLRAYHEGGHIIVEIADDGKGLGMDRIRRKVVENGLLTETEAAAMEDRQLQQYIFKPGFSTAEKVTNISGRGVGMDVVRTNIEKIGGTIELSSKEGRGTTVLIKIPLTLAIVSALVVECAKERFAIPQISVLELVRTAAESEQRIETINDTPVLRLRNRLLPLVDLRRLLKLEARVAAGDVEGVPEDALEAAPEVVENSELFIVVTQVGSYTFGIVVDRVFDTEEIVVKPVAPILRDIPFYSGNTILGDGSVIMILDPNGISVETGEVGGAGKHQEVEVPKATGRQVTSLLIFRAGGDELKAVPLSLVARLEYVDNAKVESSSGRRMVQYRGHLMPLVPFNPNHAWAAEGRQPVLVFHEGDKTMGLVVDEIVDIVEDVIRIDVKSEQPGVIGSAVIREKATDVIDAQPFLTEAFEDWFVEAPSTGNGRPSTRNILLVDGSEFFQNLVRPYLSSAGYMVTSAGSAADALALLDDGERYEAIVSAVNLPDIDGFDFAQQIRGRVDWQQVPLIALTSKDDEEFLREGRACGFTSFVPKTKRSVLLKAVEDVISRKGEAA